MLTSKILRYLFGITARFGRTRRDAMQCAPDYPLAIHTSESKRSSAGARRKRHRTVISLVFLRIALIACGALLNTAARADVVVIVSAHSHVTTLSTAQVSDIFLGKTAKFPNGTIAIPLDQVDASTVRREFYAKVTDKSPQLLKAYWSKLIFTGQGEPPREVIDSGAVKKLVASSPNSIGYIESTAADSSVKIILMLQ